MEVTGQTLGGKVGVRFGEMTQRLGCGSLEREKSQANGNSAGSICTNWRHFCKNPLKQKISNLVSLRVQNRAHF